MDNIYNILPENGIYASKDSLSKRLIFRRLYRNLINSGEDSMKRSAALKKFEVELLEHRDGDHDDIKMLWRLPEYIKTAATSDEIISLNKILALKKKLKSSLRDKIYPPCSDEIDLTPDLYSQLFGVNSLPQISRQQRICTFGSCFAANIAKYLRSTGYHAKNLPLSENINSPSSVSVLFNMLATSEDNMSTKILDWYNYLAHNSSASLSESQIQAYLNKDLGDIRYSRKLIQNADVVVVTLGNVVEYQSQDLVEGSRTLAKVPRFLSLFNEDSVVNSFNLSSLMRDAGYSLELMDFRETFDSCSNLLKAIDRLNPIAKVIVSLSPIPIDNLIGSSVGSSAIIADCISKSTLRVCIDALSKEFAFSYFPSYEIVKWVAPMTPEQIWGKEDGCSRHISEHVLLSIYRYFEDCVAAS